MFDKVFYQNPFTQIVCTDLQVDERPSFFYETSTRVLGSGLDLRKGHVVPKSDGGTPGRHETFRGNVLLVNVCSTTRTDPKQTRNRVRRSIPFCSVLLYECITLGQRDSVGYPLPDQILETVLYSFVTLRLQVQDFRSHGLSCPGRSWLYIESSR